MNPALSEQEWDFFHSLIKALKNHYFFNKILKKVFTFLVDYGILCLVL